MRIKLTKIQLFFVAVFVGLVALLVGLMLYSLLGVDYKLAVNPQDTLKPSRGVVDTAVVTPPSQSSGTTDQVDKIYASDFSTREECLAPYLAHYEGDPDITEIVDPDLMAPIFADELSQSVEGEHLVFAAMLEPMPDAKMDLAKRAVSAAPDNPVVLWNANGSCASSKECPRLQWLRKLAEIDSENGAVWMSLAAYHWRNDDKEQTFVSLKRAANASQHSIYWVDSIEMGLRALRAIGAPFSESLNAATTGAARSLPSYSPQAELCQELGEENPAVAQLCLSYAERVVDQATVTIDQALAAAISINALEQLGRLNEAQEIEQETELRELQFSDFLVRNERVSMYIYNNAANYQSFLTATRTHGELGAYVEMRKEQQAFEKAHLAASCYSAEK